MFVIKRRKIAKMNECSTLANSLGVRFRCSPRGMSVLNGTSAKFFSIDELYQDNSACKKHIKKVASAELQTTLNYF